MSSRSTRQRKEVARRKYEKYQERKRAEAARKRHFRIILVVIVIVALLIAATFWVVSMTDNGEEEPQTQPGNPLVFSQPEQVLAAGTSATATLQTNKGTITFDLNTEQAPKNSNSLAFLAGQGFFDATPCHRLTTDPTLSVLQCGSPDGSANGGPGYTVEDENLPKAGDGNYPAGTVAMAEPAGGEAGSQFFLVYEDSTLPPDYTIVGEITKGLDVLRAIGKDGTTNGTSDGPPIKPITIETFTVDQA